MEFAPVVNAVKDAGCAGFRYQKAGHQRYRDRVTVYKDGRLLFERFCYGEAAGLVFKVWAAGADETGAPRWDFTRCNVTSAPNDVPHMLTGVSAEGIFFDEKTVCWELQDRLKHDKANGYGGLVNALKNLFVRRG